MHLTHSGLLRLVTVDQQGRTHRITCSCAGIGNIDDCGTVSSQINQINTLNIVNHDTWLVGLEPYNFSTLFT